ncbi:MAG: ATP-binding protein [Candidatus Omnitrophica bacterium]|nr:ATP-binding protein [Candidatus Omnitrophota bacterium]
MNKPNDISPIPDYLPRQVDLQALLKKKSYFLFGPRQTGKSSLIAHSLKDVRVYNLLDSVLFLELSRNPARVSEELTPRDKVVVIDEIQRLPDLLNEVHRLIEEKGVRFLLTGSSARKLRHGGVNLLGGRARTQYFYPFTARELGRHFELKRALNMGLIPSIYFSSDPDADLGAYTGNYLQQEIIAEGATRNIPAFSRFLKVAALCNATIVNFTNVANDAQVARTTVYEYFEILKDTLIIRELPPFKRGRQRKPVSSSKYYFFDSGVARQMQGRSLLGEGTPEFGGAFETFLMHELTAFSDYKRPVNLSFWRSTSGFEVDFILDDHTAVEVKAKSVITPDDLRSLEAIADEYHFKRLVCVCLEKRPRKTGKIEIVHYRDFLEGLWAL